MTPIDAQEKLAGKVVDRMEQVREEQYIETAAPNRLSWPPGTGKQIHYTSPCHHL
jgi:hypothetical protein